VSVKKKYDYADAIIFLLLLSLGAIIGSYLLYIIVNYRNLVFVFNNFKSFDNIISVLRYIFGGSIFYGGLLGGILTGLILFKKYPFYRKYTDIVAASFPLFHFFGRIGCFLGGCCFGIPCKMGVTFTNNPIIEANGVVRFPVQLLEASFNLGLFFFLNYLLHTGKYKDKIIYIYLAIYAVGRFLLEYLRGDAYRGIWLIFSTSQIISILIIFALLLRYFLKKFILKSNKSLNTDLII